MNRVRLLLAAALVMSASAFAVPAVTSAAVNYFDTTRTVTKTMGAAAVEDRNYGTEPIWLSVACPSGYRVTGGGYSAEHGSRRRFKRQRPVLDVQRRREPTIGPGLAGRIQVHAWCGRHVCTGLERLRDLHSLVTTDPGL